MSRKTTILLLISGLFASAIGLSNVFVNVFLWKKTNELLVIAQYNLMHYILTPITFIIGGWLSKRKNGTWPLRIGILSYVIFFLFILIIKEQIANFIYPLGILFGIATGFYWLGFNVLSFDFTTINDRDTFNGYNGCILGICNALAPFIASRIIESSSNTKGYTLVFGISLAFFVILILISFTIQSKHYGEKLDLRKMFGSNNARWKCIRKGILLWAFRDAVIVFLVDILIYETTNSEAALGKMYLLSYLISSLAHFIEQRLIKPKRRLISIHVGAVFLFIAVLGLFIKINFTTILIYVIFNAFFIPFFWIPVTSASFNVLTLTHEENMRTEYIINRDIAIHIGRTASTVILILLLQYIKHEKIINYFLLFVGSIQIVALYFLRKYDAWCE